MSSFFDELSGKVASIASTDDADFLRQARAIEQSMIGYIDVVLSQPEVPIDIKDVIVKTINDFGIPENPVLPDDIKTINDKKMHFNVSLRHSSLVEAMHDLFHMIAEKKIKTKHGVIHDNPRFFAQMVKRDTITL